MTRPFFSPIRITLTRTRALLRPSLRFAVGVLLIALFACQKAAPPPVAGPVQQPAPVSPPKAAPAILPTPAPPGTPGLELQEEDYARVRRQFRTKLLKIGPAPDPWKPVHPPVGVTEVEYPSGNLRLKAWVNQPIDAKAKRPAVLFLHGGWSFSADDWKTAQPFREAGYIVLAPLLRGENGQPGAFTMFYDEVDDVLAAADYLAMLPYVDGGHIYVSGHSAGGTLTMLAAMASDRFRAAAPMSGSPDRISFARAFASAVPFDTSDIREYRARSPIAYAGSFKCPARLFVGSKESIYVKETRRMALLAKGKGLDVEAVVVPGDHFSAVPQEMKQAIEFFRQH